jgi:SEC-C motif
MDYAIYNVRIAGQNAVERYLEVSPPSPDSDEMDLLKAMLEARYSLFEVVDVEAGVGVTVRDALRNETEFLADIGLSSSGAMGGCLATRVIPLQEHGILMSSGAGLPVDRAVLARIINALERSFDTGTDYSLLTPDQESNLAALVIRTCLEAGMSSRIVYGTHAETSSRSKPAIDPRLLRRANPNDPCPCGSGRKFKSCCGRRPRR